MIAIDGGTQVGFAGTPVEIPPAVRVVDGSGNPVAGIDVTFLADPGNGTTADRLVVTDASGEARVGSWTLGPDPGSQRVRASAENLPTITFLAVATVPPAVFDIVIRFNRPGGTSAQRTAFRVGEARWQAVIQGEQEDVAVVRSSGFCGSTVPIDETVDDLLILADLVPIDGPGGVLGSAGPCLIRENGIPVMGRMQFDTADLDNIEAGGTLDDLIVHEMGHVLGIGSLWHLFNLSDIPAAEAGTVSDAFFSGAGARAAFNEIGGESYVGNRVPIENSGGGGTRFVHWRESVFDTELMTGFLDPGSNPLSLVTIASLEDLGYTVSRSIAEAFALSRIPRTGRSASRIDLGDDVMRAPLFTIDSNGVIRRVRVR
ncbi:MAG: leishmanolysin-related zinc metalloendopeptidase [Gemmatimonadota bacterium]